MSKMFRIESAPGVFPSINGLSDFGVASSDMKPKFSSRRDRSPMHICKLACELNGFRRLLIMLAKQLRLPLSAIERK